VSRPPDAREQLAPTLERAFPIGPGGTFTSLLLAIDEAERNGAPRLGADAKPA
jgi:hypothetical protein